METSSLGCLLPPLIALSRCSLSWKRLPDASLLGVSLSLGRWPQGEGILLWLTAPAVVLSHDSGFCWFVCDLPSWFL